MRELREAREKAEGKPPPKPQEPAPTIYPDMMWVWKAFCDLSDRRGVGPSGPVPVTLEAMNAYLELTNRKCYPYAQQVLHFIPILDREYLRDFYDKQAKEMEKTRKQSQPKKGKRAGLNRR